MPINSHGRRSLRRGCAAASLLGLWVRFPGRGMDVLRVLSGGGLSAGLITRPEDYYRLWCAWVWSWSLDNEGSRSTRPVCAMEIN